MRLRALDPIADAEALHAIYSDHESCRYLSHSPFSSVAETRSALVSWTRGCEATSWAVLDDGDETARGRVSLIPTDDAVYEAAVMIVPDARGRGFGRASMAQALDWAFAHRARRIFADIDPDNAPSLRLFERLGFVREGYLRQTWETHIGIRDTLLLAIVASDPRPWRA